MPLSPPKKEGDLEFRISEFLFFRSLAFPDFLRPSFFSLLCPVRFLSRERKRGGRRDYNVAHFFSFFPVLFGYAGNYAISPFFLFLSLGMAFCPSPLFVYATYGRNIFSREQNCLWDATLEKTYIVRRLRLNKY